MNTTKNKKQIWIQTIIVFVEATTGLPSTQDLVKRTKLLSKNRRFETLRKLAFHMVSKNKISFEKYCDTSKRLKIIIESNWYQFLLITNKYKLL